MANVDVALSDAFRVVDLIGVFANAALGGVPAQVVPARYRKRLRSSARPATRAAARHQGAPVITTDALPGDAERAASHSLGRNS